MGRNPITPPVQFTKDELRALEKEMRGALDGGYAYRGQTHRLACHSALQKVKAALFPPLSSPSPEPDTQ